MRNTNKDWIELIQYRNLFDNGSIKIDEYVSTSIRYLNDSKMVGDNPIIFMDNIGHVFPIRILSLLSSNEINKLIKNRDFIFDIKKFFNLYGNHAIEYTKTHRINEYQYAFFQKILGFKLVEESLNIDKKWFMLVLKRSKNAN